MQRLSRLRPLVGGFFLLGLLACRSEPAAQQAAPLLEVNGRSITLEQFDAEFERTLFAEQGLTAEQQRQLRTSFLHQLLNRELALAEAERLGLGLPSEELERAVADYRRDYPDGAFEQMLRDQGQSEERWRAELRERLLVEKVVQRQVYSGITVDDAEVEAWYRAHQDEFDRPERVRARQILVATEEQGLDMLEKLHAGADFAELARQYSLSPDREEGGDLGYFGREEMPPEFDRVVFSQPVGRVSDLVKSEYGYHLFLVEDLRPAEQLTLDQVQEQIARRLRRDKEAAAYRRWLKELAGRADLRVDWARLGKQQSGETE